ncbi:hypothetical protein Tco_0519013 [Tanacetum coccineum]
METLSPGLWIDANVVDYWGEILNYEDRFRKDGSLSRHFFRTGCITMSMFDGTLSTDEDKWKSFAAEVSAQFKDNVGGLALSGIDLNWKCNSSIEIPLHEKDSISDCVRSKGSLNIYTFKDVRAFLVQEMKQAVEIYQMKRLKEGALEAHYGFMAKIQRHSEQPESINDTYVLEKDDSNVIPDSSNIYKTILDSHCFVHELKKEMNDDLEYVNSLEKELDELESEKADFSNILIYFSRVSTECECHCTKAFETTESVNKEVHNNLLKSFAKLEKHSISLELSLQHCKEQMKNNPVCKENASNVFRKEREQYHEIQDLKAQMQDKNMVISELKKLIENCKGKSVETQFNKPSVVRQPNAQRIPKPSIRKQAVRNTNVIAPGPSRNCPKHVSHQSPREKVGSNDMVHNYYLEKAKKSAQLQKDKEVNGKPSMINPARILNC